MGVKQAGFLVLRETSMPGCLIELGFISTPDEERYLNTQNGIDAMGRGIYQAFVDYKRQLNGGGLAEVDSQQEKKTEVAVQEIMPVDAAKEDNVTVGKQSTEKNIAPVFKIQILSTSLRVKGGNNQFKGLENIDYYEENGLYKYTYGSSADYNEIYQLRKNIIKKFPQAFIVAFKGDLKVNVNDAIREFKENKNKR
jgi:N-acetylmuramoyl-L-alanine amidase